MKDQKELGHITLPGILIFVGVFLSACTVVSRSPDLGRLYNTMAQHESPERNPVILIPGLMGSKLVDNVSGNLVWGMFGPRGADPGSADGARLTAIPMQEGKQLSGLRDTVVPDGALDRVIVDFFGYPLEQRAYAYILSALGVGGYRDQALSDAGAVDWGEDHFTCFQFDYDWRRDIVESARSLDRFIHEKRSYVRGELEKRFGEKDYDVKFDLVAHSMGGLVARYYLRYGTADLPDDGSLPPVTWAGSRYVDNLVVIGTPNAGAVEALEILVNGYRPALILPRYSATVLGTMPSLYQLLPRSRHQPLLDNNGRPDKDIFSPDLWRKNRWGLANPKQDRILHYLLPDIDSAAERRRIALDHQTKVLNRARQFVHAMDRPVKRPPSLRYFLIAGDAENTAKKARYDSHGRLKIVAKGPGDRTVLRSSALLDERQPGDRVNRLISPIRWNQVFFIFADHVELTQKPVFTDNLLYILLESQSPI